MTKTIAALISAGVAVVVLGAAFGFSAVGLAAFAAVWYAGVWIFTKTLGRREL